jgi:hypothetical protein
MAKQPRPIFPQPGAHFDEKIPLGVKYARSYRTFRDGFFPGDAIPGTSCQADFADYGAPRRL